MPLIAEIFEFWESFGIFTIILPFILFFAILYGLLTRIKFFPNRTTNIVLAATIGLIATALGYYGDCLSTLVISTFIAITTVLVFSIIAGFMIEKSKIIQVISWIAAAIAFITTFIVTPYCKLFSISSLWIIAAIVIGLIVWIVLGKDKSKDSPKDKSGKRPLHGPQLPASR